MEEKFEASELLSGRPDREISDKEKDCYDMLDELDIYYERVEFNIFPETLEDLCKSDEKLKMPGIKNLMFKTKNGSQFFLLVLARSEKLDIKEFRAKHGLSKIEMAKDADLEKVLNTHSGAVSITELMYDKDNKIKLYIDEKLLEQEYMRFHPNENLATLKIKMKDFKEKVIPYLKHEVNIL